MTPPVALVSHGTFRAVTLNVSSDGFVVSGIDGVWTVDVYNQPLAVKIEFQTQSVRFVSCALNHASAIIEISSGATIAGSISGVGLTRLKTTSVAGSAAFGFAVASVVDLQGTISLGGTFTILTALSGNFQPPTAFVATTSTAAIVAPTLTATWSGTACSFFGASQTLTINTPNIAWAAATPFAVSNTHMLALTDYASISQVNAAGTCVVATSKLSGTFQLIAAGSSNVEFRFTSGGAATFAGSISNSGSVAFTATSGTAKILASASGAGAWSVNSGVEYAANVLTIGTLSFKAGSSIGVGFAFPGGGTCEASGGGTVYVNAATGSLTIAKLNVLAAPTTTVQVIGSSSNQVTITTLNLAAGTTLQSSVGIQVTLPTVAFLTGSILVGPATFHIGTASSFLTPVCSDANLIFHTAITSLVGTYATCNITVDATVGMTTRSTALAAKSLSILNGAKFVFDTAVTSTIGVLTISGGSTLLSSAARATVNTETVTFVGSTAVPAVLNNVVVTASAAVNVVAASVGISAIYLTGNSLVSVPPPQGLAVTYGNGAVGTGRTVLVYSDGPAADMIDFGFTPQSYVTYPGQSNPGLVNLTACFTRKPHTALPASVSHNPPFACDEPGFSTALPLSSSALTYPSSSAQAIVPGPSSSAELVPPSSSAAAINPISSLAAVQPALSSSAAPSPFSSTVVAVPQVSSSAAQMPPPVSSSAPAAGNAVSSSADAFAALSSTAVAAASTAVAACFNCSNGAACMTVTASTQYVCFCSAAGTSDGAECQFLTPPPLSSYTGNEFVLLLRPDNTHVLPSATADQLIGYVELLRTAFDFPSNLLLLRSRRVITGSEAQQLRLWFVLSLPTAAAVDPITKVVTPATAADGLEVMTTAIGQNTDQVSGLGIESITTSSGTTPAGSLVTSPAHPAGTSSLSTVASDNQSFLIGILVAIGVFLIVMYVFHRWSKAVSHGQSRLAEVVWVVVSILSLAANFSFVLDLQNRGETVRFAVLSACLALAVVLNASISMFILIREFSRKEFARVGLTAASSR